MTEAEYQAMVRPLDAEVRARASVLVDYLASQPAKRLGMQEALAFAWWCLSEGAQRQPAVMERGRRMQLARHGAA